MGCTPSIHVNQTGLVICRESEDSNSHIASYSAAYHTRVVKSDGTTETSSGVAVTSLDKQSAFKELVPLTLKQGNESLNIEAQTQTSIRIEMKVCLILLSVGILDADQKVNFYFLNLKINSIHVKWRIRIRIFIIPIKGPWWAV